MEQTIVLPIALGSRAYVVLKKFNSETGRYENSKIYNITVTSATLWRNGTVKHYISGNFKHLPENVHPTKEEAEKTMLINDSFHW